MNEIDLLIDLAEKLYDSGDYDGAIAKCKEAIGSVGTENDGRAWNILGNSLYQLGNYEESLSKFDAALIREPNKPCFRTNRANSFLKLKRYSEAAKDYLQAFEDDPEYVDALNGLGTYYIEMECWQEAINTLRKALDIYQDHFYAICNLGTAYAEILQYDEALDCYYKSAYSVNANPLAWNGIGSVFFNRGLYRSAIPFYERAVSLYKEQLDKYKQEPVSLQNKYCLTRCNLAHTYLMLVDKESAILTFDALLYEYPQCWLGWLGRAEAICRCDRVNQKLIESSPLIKKYPHLKSHGYQGAINTYEVAKGIFSKESHSEAYGRICHSWGLNLYERVTGSAFFNIEQGLVYGEVKASNVGGLQLTAFEDILKLYEEAIDVLDLKSFPEERLAVIADMIQIYLRAGKPNVLGLINKAGDNLTAIISDPSRSEASKRRIALKFKKIEGLGAHDAFRRRELVKSIVTAELIKNSSLTWIYERCENLSQRVRSEWQQGTEIQWHRMQGLVDEFTGAIFWYVSGWSLLTFIIRQGEREPLVIDGVTNSLVPNERLTKFNGWLSAWDSKYKNYIKRQDADSVGFFDEADISKLRTILNIGEIEDKLKGIRQLILIPHDNLHRLPLHLLFESKFDIYYLPSVEMGLNLPKLQRSDLQLAIALSIMPHVYTNEAGDAEDTDNLSCLQGACAEAKAVAGLFPESQCINTSEGNAANRLVAELSLPTDVFHFTGHAKYNWKNPSLSGLFLNREEVLPVEDAIKMSLGGCKIVGLSACETGLVGSTELMTEYVGVASVFLRQGVNCILASLWAIDDCASCLLVAKFYSELLRVKNASIALQNAQKWLRESEREVFQEFLNGLKLSYSERLNLKQMIWGFDEEKPFTNSYYWAGFYIIGWLS